MDRFSSLQGSHDIAHIASRFLGLSGVSALAIMSTHNFLPCDLITYHIYACICPAVPCILRFKLPTFGQSESRVGFFGGLQSFTAFSWGSQSLMINARLRISMQDIRTLLRHYDGEQSSKREVARLLQLSPGTVRNYLRRAEAAGLSWPLPERLTDEELEALLFPHSGPISCRPQPDRNQVHQQLSRKGMTLERILFDWIQEYPNGYSYGYFCACYKKRCRAQKITMRIHHKAGERLYVDFAGKRMEVMDPSTGQVTKVQIFVAAMGGSNYTYVEAMPDQTLRSWIEAHVRCLTFLGAGPASLSAIT